MNLQRLLSYVRRACEDYAMIEEGDRIAVGISGGKDSLSLLTALAEMRQFYPKRFEVEAITISLGLPGFDLSPVQSLCDRLNVTYTVECTDIGEIIFNIRQEKNPCSLCAKLRRGALNNKALSLGCNKIALGHNRDDVVETFFLSLFYEGRINTFSPVTYLDRTNLHVIRPLIYVPEKDVRAFVKSNDIQIVKSPCPVDGKTNRQTMKNFVAEQNAVYGHFDEKIFGAIQRSDIDGWERQ